MLQCNCRAGLDLGKIDWTRIDATTDEQIDAQVAADADMAPTFTEDEILAAGRKIEADAVTRALAHRDMPL